MLSKSQLLKALISSGWMILLPFFFNLLKLETDLLLTFPINGVITVTIFSETYIGNYMVWHVNLNATAIRVNQQSDGMPGSFFRALCCPCETKESSVIMTESPDVCWTLSGQLLAFSFCLLCPWKGSHGEEGICLGTLRSRGVQLAYLGQQLRGLRLFSESVSQRQWESAHGSLPENGGVPWERILCIFQAHRSILYHN